MNDTIPTRADNSTIDRNWFNVLKNVLIGDFVNRDSSGVAADSFGALGTSAYPWLRLFFGAAASGLSLEEETGAIIMKVGGVKKFKVDTTGLLRQHFSPTNSAVSLSSGAFSTTAVVTTPVTNLSVSLQTYGGDVELELVSDGTNASVGTGDPIAYLEFYKGSTLLSRQVFGNASASFPSSAFRHTEKSIAAGTNTYSVKVQSSTGAGVFVTSTKLVVREL